MTGSAVLTGPASAGTTGPSPESVPTGTIADVLAWVGEDPARAQAAYDVEVAGQNRSTLLAELERRGAS